MPLYTGAIATRQAANNPKKKAVAVVGTDPATWNNLVFNFNWDSAGVVQGTPPDVATWGDDSPAGNDVTIATDSLRPHLTASSIQFDGADDELGNLAGTDLYASGAYTAVWALNIVSCGTDGADYANEGWIGNASGWWGLVCRSSYKLGVYHYADSLFQSVSATAGKHIVAIRWDGTAAYIRIDANAWESGAVGVPSAQAGAAPLGVNNVKYFDGHIYHGVWTTDENKGESATDEVIAFYNALIGAF